MADTVTGPTILQENEKRVTIKLVVQSDGSGSTTVFGDRSTMASLPNGKTCKTLSIQRLWFATDNSSPAYARLDYEDDDGDIPILGLVGTGYWDFREFGGLAANQTANDNEDDINLVVPSTAVDGSMFTVVMECTKTYTE
jgi:hypothetical protein|tara:strand:+ start:261 stop:680 length:420 start_codon:yes stop_codon:yes gene_type:complete